MTDRPQTFSTGTRLKAWLCRVCPFCVAARRWPDSRYARKLRKIEQNCPFCRAHARVFGKRSITDRP